MKLRGFITHKAAEYYSDCADYFRICPETKRVAVSDGVSQSIMPAEWARILVDSFVNEEWNPGESTTLLKERWLTQAREFANEQRKSGKNPWMLENCLVNKDGAAATFCGIVFLDESKWIASILGDSSIVEIDKNYQIVSICSSKEGTFNNRPDFFDSFNENNGEIRHFDGTLDKGSKILLVSDPFSELFQKVKGTPIEEGIVKRLLDIANINGFCATVDDLRKEHQMHNDDSTLVIIEPDESACMTILYQKTLDSSLQDEKRRLEKERIDFERKKEQDEKYWRETIEENNEVAYNSYIENSELCVHRKEAEKCLKEIEKIRTEGKIWEEACSINKVEVYQKYIEMFPYGRFVTEAEKYIRPCRPSTHIKRPEVKDDSAETQSSEDSFCKGEGQAKGEQPFQKSSAMDKENSDTSGEKSAKPVPHQAETIPENCRENETIASADSQTKKTEIVSTFIGEDSRTPNNSNLKMCGVNTKEVEADNGEFIGTLSLPSGVDPSDGIDKVEFQRLQETAVLLFGKYHNQFRDAFHREKWKTDYTEMINQLFVDYWSELERLIYQNKNYG